MNLLNYISMLAQDIAKGKKKWVEVEQEIFQMVRALGCLVLEEVLRQADEFIHASPQRPGTGEGFRTAYIQTVFGEVQYRRRLYRERKNHGQSRWRYLLDEKLGLREKQVVSPTVEKLAAYVATRDSYRGSAKILQAFGIPISHGTVHKAVERLGQSLKRRQQERMRTDTGEGKRVVEGLFLESDGIYISLQGKDRKKRSKHEVKVGCLYEGWEPVDETGRSYRLKNPTVFATLGNSEEYWDLADELILSNYDVEQIPCLVFGSDGASWCKEGLERYPRAVHQIDEFHFTRWIKQVFGFQERSFVDTLSALIHADDREGLVRALEEWKKKKKAAKSKIEALKQTLLRNWESLKDYRTRVKPLPKIARGIGNIENVNDNMVADRMKKRGMSWSIRGAEHLLQVKSAVMNGIWDEIYDWLETGRRLSEKQFSPMQKEKPARKGERRKVDVVEWCQARMPGAEGRESWLREFSRSIQRLQEPSMLRL